MNATQFLESAASVSLQAAIVVAVTAGLRQSGRTSARAECRLWHGSNVVILALTAIAATFPHLRLLAHGAIDPGSAIAAAESRNLVGLVLLFVWLAGVLLSTLSLLAGWLSAARCLRRCRTVEPAELPVSNTEFEQVIDGQTVRFRTGPHIAGPCCWQFHRPYILLPEGVLSLRPRELLFVLRHELAHLCQGHPLQLFVQRVVEIVFWFHPLIWWSAHQAALAREYACDEAVAGTRDEIADYLRTLLAVIEQSHTIGEPCGQTLNFGASASVIAGRARRLVQRAKSPLSIDRDSTWAALGRPAVLAICGVACLAAWLPLNSLASSRSVWSPWPSWSASLASDLGWPARDYEAYDRWSDLHELREAAESSETPDIED